MWQFYSGRPGPRLFQAVARSGKGRGGAHPLQYPVAQVGPRLGLGWAEVGPRLGKGRWGPNPLEGCSQVAGSGRRHVQAQVAGVGKGDTHFSILWPAKVGSRLGLGKAHLFQNPEKNQKDHLVESVFLDFWQKYNKWGEPTTYISNLYEEVYNVHSLHNKGSYEKEKLEVNTHLGRERDIEGEREVRTFNAHKLPFSLL